MKRVILWLVVLIAVTGIAAVGFSNFFGSIRVQREAAAYIEALENCAPIEQDAWAPLLRGTANRSVIGPDEGACEVSMEVLGGGTIRCRLEKDGVEVLKGYVQEGSDTVTFFGGQSASIRYSSENPDPFTELLNGPNCALN